MAHEHTKEVASDEEDENLSTTENQWGIDLTIAKPLGLVGLLISILLLLDGLSNLTQTGSFSAFLVLAIGCFGAVISSFFCISEKKNHELDQRFGKLTEDDDENPEDTIFVCRECHSEISKDANRCPNCGWKPKKKSGLYKGTAGALSLTPAAPIGWVMGKRAVQDGIKAQNGIGKEVDKAEFESNNPRDNPVSENDPIASLERLSQLLEQGAITEDEFEEQKAKLLDKIQ